MSPTTNGGFDRLTAKYELPSRILKLVAEYRQLDPEAADALVGEMAEACGLQARPGLVPSADSDEAVKLVRAFFAEHRGESFTKPDMAALTGLSENTIHTLIYRTLKDEFERLPNPEGGRARLYRLKGVKGP